MDRNCSSRRHKHFQIALNGWRGRGNLASIFLILLHSMVCK
ncbi:hypothetical protein DEFR109230_09835 [Deinococcus frigens]